MTSYNVLILSDGTGDTAYRLLKAAMRQFDEDIIIARYANVREIEQIDDIIRGVRRGNPFIVYTFAPPVLRDHIQEVAAREGLHCVDVLGPLVSQLSDLFHRPPVSVPGLLHQVDEEYYDRVDTINFAIRHDDGALSDELDQADIVLVGVSRTSKTPLSVYLAQEGWRVANVPIVVGKRLPSQLFELDQHKIVGLVIDPARLADARKVRLQQLGLEGGSYADTERIEAELEYAKAVFDQNPRWPVIDVTGKSIEEVSQEILDAVIGRMRKL